MKLVVEKKPSKAYRLASLVVGMAVLFGVPVAADLVLDSVTLYQTLGVWVVLLFFFSLLTLLWDTDG